MKMDFKDAQYCFANSATHSFSFVENIRFNFIKNLISLVLIGVLTACSHNQIYRSEFAQICNASAQQSCDSAAIQRHNIGAKNEYYLGIVEYDDQGQLRSPAQKQAVLETYYQLASNKDVLIITFVHGWHHNASPKDKNLLDFRNKVLAKISKEESEAAEKENRDQRLVLGVFIGWRGESIEIPWVNTLTFWDRKNTAHEVGQLGVTELLLKLEEVRNVKKAINNATVKQHTSRMVVIGHSFGGAVVYTALQKILHDRFIDSREDKTFSGDAKGFADVVVLVNPAFEALRYAPLYDLSQMHCRGYSDTQLPKLAILTSEADWATGVAFPLGRIFSTLFESHQKINRNYCASPGKSGEKLLVLSEGEADRTAVGHFEDYLTHQLTPSNMLASGEFDFEPAALTLTWLSKEQDRVIGNTILSSFNRTTPNNPYLNIRVDNALSDGHNDIWGEQLVSFIQGLVLLSAHPLDEGRVRGSK